MRWPLLITGVDDEPDPKVILALDPCGNLVVARNFATGEAVKYGDKYAAHLLATWGTPVYFAVGVGNATYTRSVGYDGVLPEEGMTQERANK